MTIKKSLLLTTLVFLATQACKKDPADIPVEKVELNQTTLTLILDNEAELKATVTPANATNGAITWSSDQPTIVSVTDGKIKALASGSAKITATAGDKSATCNVTVPEPTVPTPKFLYLPGVTTDMSLFRYGVMDNSGAIKYVTWQQCPLEFKQPNSLPYQATMNIIGNDTIVHVLGYNGEVSYNSWGSLVFKNNEPYVVTDNSIDAEVQSLFFSGTDIYAVGMYIDGTTWKACYWKNRVKIDLPVDKNARAYKMLIHNNHMYVTGAYESIPSSYISPIYSSGKDVPCYWIDGICQSLPFDMPDEENTYYRGEAHSIIIDDGQVCIAGKVIVNEIKPNVLRGYTRFCYWKDGDYQYDPDRRAGFAGWPNLYVHKGDMYVPGTFNLSDGGTYHPCYWKHGVPVELSGSLSVDVATSILFDGDDMFVTGASLEDSSNSAIWKNDVQTPLTDFLPLGQIFIK